MIKDFLSYLSTEKRYSAYTIKSYAHDLSQLSSYILATYDISHTEQAERLHLRDWVAHLAEKRLSPTTVNRKIASVKSYFKFLHQRGHIASNPSTTLKPLKTAKKLPLFLKEQEMTSLLDNLVFEDGFSGLRDQLMLELLYATGIRRAELIFLKESSLNFYDKTVRSR